MRRLDRAETTTQNLRDLSLRKILVVLEYEDSSLSEGKARKPLPHLIQLWLTDVLCELAIHTFAEQPPVVVTDQIRDDHSKITTGIANGVETLKEPKERLLGDILRHGCRSAHQERDSNERDSFSTVDLLERRSLDVEFHRRQCGGEVFRHE
jgi:hypothetical protein